MLGWRPRRPAEVGCSALLSRLAGDAYPGNNGQKMDESALFDEICALLTAVGVEIRVERFSTPPDSAGGLCRVAGKNLVLLHSGSSKAERGRALLEVVEQLGLDRLGVRGAELSPTLLSRLNRRGQMPWPHRRQAPPVAKPIGAHPHHHLRLIMPTPPLAALTTVGLGGIPAQFESAATESELVDLVRSASSAKRTLLLLGGGSNIVAQDGNIDATVVRLALRGISIKHQRDKVLVTAYAGEAWHDFVEAMTGEGFAGIECLGGIPGSVGATPIQNVGAYGQEVSQVIEQVRVLNRKTLKFRSLRAQDCGFGYRSSLFKTSARDRYVVVSVTFALTPRGAPSLNYAELKRALPGDASLMDAFNEVIKLRRSKSMVYDTKDENHRSCGSFFVNPQLTAAQFDALKARLGSEVPSFPGEHGSFKIPAAWLIERAGFTKGMRVGPVGLSSKHALCLVAHDGATSAHLIGLAQQIRQRVESELGVRLIPEPDFWGFDQLDDRLPLLDLNAIT